MGLVYRIENGRLWGVDAACFVKIAPDDAEIVQLYADGKLAGEDYLIRTLRFYGHPLGELTPLDDLRALRHVEQVMARGRLYAHPKFRERKNVTAELDKFL